MARISVLYHFGNPFALPVISYLLKIHYYSHRLDINTSYEILYQTSPLALGRTVFVVKGVS